MKKIFKSKKTKNGIFLKEGEFLLTEAKWDDNTPWKFIVSKKKPDPNLCTAVFCITSHRGKLLLVENKKRGWEIPGGHIDKGEEIDQALIRETMEETGAVIENPQMFGYKIISPTSPIPHRDKKGSYYPFPHSFIPYYYAEVSKILDIKLSPDVVGIKLVSFADAKSMLSPGHKHDKILQHLIKTKSINIDE